MNIGGGGGGGHGDDKGLAMFFFLTASVYFENSFKQDEKKIAISISQLQKRESTISVLLSKPLPRLQFFAKQALCHWELDNNRFSKAEQMAGQHLHPVKKHQNRLL